jgi:3-oxoacyl-[acyl-carrier-protein] synthase III
VRIAAATVALPSRLVSNDDVLELIRRNSEKTFAGDLNSVLASVDALLRRSGAESRHWLAPGETPLALTTSAVEGALSESGYAKSEIDLLIYAAVDRGFIDPANAYFVAKALGMDRVHCFDVVDACNSWSRALLLAYSLFRTGFYRRALLVSVEFPLFEGGAIYPDLFRLKGPSDVKWSFAGFTLGEAASATVLSHDPDRNWEFRFSSRADLADSCVVPLPGYARYCLEPDHVAHNGLLRFAADGAQMFSKSRYEITELFRALSIPVEEIAAVFPHAATVQGWADGCEPLGIAELIYNVYPRCGNVASASIPTGIALAAAEGRIARGDRLVCLTGSAGMSFAAYSFVY